MVSGRYMKKVRKEYQDKLALANSTAEEAISNLRTVRAFSNERKMTSLYDIDINSSYRLGKILSVLSALFTGLVFPLIYVRFYNHIPSFSCSSSSSLSIGCFLFDPLVWRISCIPWTIITRETNLYVYLSICRPVYMYIYLSVYLSVDLSISICLSIYLLTCLYLFVCLSIC